MNRIILDANLHAASLKNNAVLNQVTEGVLWILLVSTPLLAYADYTNWRSLQEQSLYWHFGLPILQAPEHLAISGLHSLLLLTAIIVFFQWIKGLSYNRTLLFPERPPRSTAERTRQTLGRLFFPQTPLLQNWEAYHWYLLQHGYQTIRHRTSGVYWWWLFSCAYFLLFVATTILWLDARPIESQIKGQLLQFGAHFLALPALLFAILMVRKIQRLENDVYWVYQEKELEASRYYSKLQIRRQ